MLSLTYLDHLFNYVSGTVLNMHFFICTYTQAYVLYLKFKDGYLIYPILQRSWELILCSSFTTEIFKTFHSIVSNSVLRALHVLLHWIFLAILRWILLPFIPMRTLKAQKPSNWQSHNTNQVLLSPLQTIGRISPIGTDTLLQLTGQRSICNEIKKYLSF